MTIYLIQLEAIPHIDNPESEECVGAFVNCWVKTTNIKLALNKAQNYVINQGWEVISIEEQFIASRDMYLWETDEDEELLECFDEAMREGISAIFYTYSSKDEEDEGEDELDIIHWVVPYVTQVIFLISKKRWIMSVFPDEIDFISLFECETKLLDDSKDYSFYCNESTFRFSNGEEDFIVTLSPSYGDVKIQVNQSASKRLISILDLKRVEKFEITADKKDHSSVLLTVNNDDSLQIIEIDFKPYFKQIFKEHLTK